MTARGLIVGALFGLVMVGCGRSERLEACNIAHEQCQTDIYYSVMRARGDGWDPFDGLPPIQTIPLAQYAKQLKDDAAARAAAASKPEQKPKLDPWSVALQLLGLVAPATTTGQAAAQSRVDNVAAFYSSGTGKVTVLDRGDEHDDRRDTVLLAHELVHAFQDNEVSGTIGGDTNDGSFTGRAQIEGEAVLYQNLIVAELDGFEPQQANWIAYYRDERDGLRGRVAQERSPFYAVNWFVYSLGAGLMTKAWLDGGNAAVRELGSTFPRHAAQLMAASDGEPLPSIASELACEVTGPTDQFARVGYDRFGGMQLYAFLAAGGALDDAEAWRRGKRWRDDAILVFFNEADEQVLVTWRIRLADAHSADVVVDVASKREGLRAERIGSDALIVGSNDEDLLESWSGARDCQQ